jgi:hypothetical protein
LGSSKELNDPKVKKKRQKKQPSASITTGSHLPRDYLPLKYSRWIF